MFETPITVVGRVISDVTTRVVPNGGKVANFRIACQERRYDKEQDTWVDGDRLYLSVTGWRRLAEGVAALERGDQVVVSGRLRLREYTAEDGARRTSTEIDARAVGPDLAWHSVFVNRQDWARAPGQLSLVDTAGSADTAVREEAIDAA